MSKRVIFTFDARSLETLEDMTRNGHFATMADVVRVSLSIARAIQQQAQLGFTELIVRNPSTGAERVLIIPNLV